MRLLALALGLCPVPSFGAAAYVQSAVGAITNDSLSMTAVATLGTTTVGNSLIVAVSWDAAGTPTAATADGNANTGWVACTARQGPYTFNQYHQIFFLPRIAMAGPAHSVTVTFSPAAGFRRMVVHEVTGLDTTATNCDQSAVNVGMGTSLVAGPITPTANGAYVFATAMNMDNGVQTFAPGAPFTERGVSLPGSGEMQTQDFVQGPAAPVSATWTYSASGNYTVQVASFKARGPVLLQKARACIGYACGGFLTERYSVSLPAPTAPGSTVIAFVYWTWMGPARAAELVDNQGNAWLSVPAVLHGSTTSAGQILYAPGIRGGSLTVTVSLGACFDHAVGLALLEYSGLSPTDTLDVSAGQMALTATADASTPPITTTGPDELLVAGFNNVTGSGTTTAGPGWTSQLTDTPFYMMVEDRFASAPGTYSGTSRMPRSDADWIATIAAFRSTRDAGPGSDAGTRNDAGLPDAGLSLLVQRDRLMATGTTSLAIPFPAATTAGNQLLAFGYWDGDASASVTDSAGNLYSPVPRVEKPGLASCQIFHAVAADGGAHTVTITRGDSVGRLGLAIFEYSGIVSTGALDVSAGQPAPANLSATASTPAVITRFADELLFAGFFDPANQGIAVPASGWSRQSCSADIEVITQDRLASTAGSYTATAMLPVASNTWLATIAAFRLTPRADAGQADAGPGAQSPTAFQLGCGCDAPGDAIRVWTLACLVVAAARRRRFTASR